MDDLMKKFQQLFQKNDKCTDFILVNREPNQYFEKEGVTKIQDTTKRTYEINKIVKFTDIIWFSGFDPP